MHSEEYVPNERLRRARNLKGWTQAELAEQVGTSFEMVSRWERGIVVPSPHYRKRLCTVLSQTPEELGLVRDLKNPFTPPSSPVVLLASSHADVEKAIVSHLKAALEERGITLWSSRHLGKPRNGNVQATLHEVVHAAHAILVIVSPESRASRNVRETLEMANIYERPVCGVWIEGEHWQDCLPEGHVELAALIDARERDTPAMLEETARALEQVRLAAQSSIPDTALEATNGATPLPAVLPLSAVPTIPGKRMGLSRTRVGLLVGLAILVIAGGILGSLSLLAHFGVFGTRSGPTTPARGGTWTQTLPGGIDSLIPNGSGQYGAVMDQALYLPLFYGDAQGVIHPGAATQVPTIGNGDVTADATTWTFHLRPHLLWSDGQPYDCPRCGLHLAALAQPQVRGRHYVGSGSDQLG